MNMGIEFRDHPLSLDPISTKKWVTICRLAYKTPHEFIRKALEPFGQVHEIKPEIINRVATGTLFTFMEVKKDIPSMV